VLAKSILDHESSSKRAPNSSRKRKLNAADTLMCDWFYSTRGGEILMAHKSLMQSLLYQLLHQSAPLFRYFRDISRQYPPLSKDWVTVESMLGLLKAIATTGIRTICVVDAMDESEDANAAEQQRRTVLSQFSLIASECSTSRMKLLILSRPSPDIEKHFWSHYRRYENLHFIIFEHENRDDIRKIIESGISSLRRAMHPFAYHYDESSSSQGQARQRVETPQQSRSREQEEKECQKMKSYLESHANGVILWVTVILSILKTEVESGAFTFRRLHEKMEKLPRDLESLYASIIRDLSSKLDEYGWNTARKALMWVSGANAFHSLTAIQLREALAIPEGFSELVEQDDPIESNLIPVNDWTEFRYHLRKLCGPLIEIIRPAAQGTVVQTENDLMENAMEDVLPSDRVQLLHRTVKDFLADPMAPEGLFFTGKDAIQRVRDDSQTYIAVALPTSQTPYAPFPSKAGTAWTDHANNILSYIEHRVLLSFILVAFPDESSAQKIIHSIIDDPITPHWKLKSDLEEELRVCSFFKGRPLPEEDNLKLSRKVISADYVRGACSRGLIYALQTVLLIIENHMKDWNSDSDFVGYLAHTLLILAIQYDVPECSAPLIEKIHNGLFPEWHPRRTAVDYVDGLFTYKLSPYEMASVQRGDEDMIERLYELTQQNLGRDQKVQRPGKERVLELAQRQKYSHLSDEQQPQSYLVAGDFKEAIRLACTLINVPQAKMPNRDEEKEEPESPSQEPESTTVQLRNEKSQCKHVCSGGVRKRDGKACKHRCCRKGLSNARKRSPTQHTKRKGPSPGAIK
jgi:hypothetical protein